MTFPATNLNEAVGLIVPDSNALHDIINGDADDTVITPEGRGVPTVLKAMADSLLLKDPILWEDGTLEQDPLQLRTFTDGLIYWAPTAQLTNPIAMGASPIGDSNWKISPIIKSHNTLTNRDEAGAHPASAIDGVIELFDTVADMKTATWLQAGKVISTGSTSWKVSHGSVGIQLPSGQYVTPLNGFWLEDFIEEGDLDDTKAWQRANDYAELVGGTTINLPPREVIVSMSESSHPYACVLVPEKTVIKGAGRDFTKVTRPSSDRANNGVLIVNKDYDTTGHYGAASNITLEHFEIDDGSVSSSRGLGDLIGLGHGKNITIRYMKVGNHDQHFVDIASCSGVKIYDCVGVNEQTNVQVNSNSTIQIDAASGLGIWGLFIEQGVGSGTYASATENIEIFRNDLENKNASVIELCHAEWARYNNIDIRDNPRLSGGFGATHGGVIHLDDVRRWSHLVGLKITNNGLQGNSSGARLINLFSNRDLSTFSNITIEGNYGVTKGQTGLYDGATNEFQTIAESAIYVGNSPSYTSALSGRDQNFFNVKVLRNSFAIKGNSVNQRVATLFNVSGECAGNNLVSTMVTRVNQPVMLIDTPRNLNVNNNSLFNVSNSGDIQALSSALTVKKSLNYQCISDIHENNLNGDNLSYCYLMQGVSHIGVDDVTFRNNRFSGSPALYEIEEAYPSSDGSNGWQQINAGGSNGLLAIASGNTYALHMPFRKNSQYTSAKIELVYSASGTTLGFTEDVEQIQCSLSSSEFIGTQVARINPKMGTFEIRTGNGGVSIILNDISQAPVTRTSGALKIYAGI